MPRPTFRRYGPFSASAPSCSTTRQASSQSTSTVPTVSTLEGGVRTGGVRPHGLTSGQDPGQRRRGGRDRHPPDHSPTPMNQPNRLCRDLALTPTVPLTGANSIIAPSVGELDGHGSRPAPAREQRRGPVHLADAHNSVVAADVGVVEHDHAAGGVPAMVPAGALSPAGAPSIVSGLGGSASTSWPP